MKIDKITFKNEQAWIVIRSDFGTYLGTWHVVDISLVKAIQRTMPIGLNFIERKEE